MYKMMCQMILLHKYEITINLGSSSDSSYPWEKGMYVWQEAG